MNSMDRNNNTDLKCPLCRIVTSLKNLKINENMVSKLKKKFPKTFKKTEEELSKEKVLEKNKRKIYFRFGNKHDLLEEETKKNRHKWSLYCKCEEHYQDLSIFLKKIEFQLHPDFGDHTRFLTAPSFQTGNIYGWGTFTIPYKVIFQDWLNIPDYSSHHFLSFDSDDHFTRFCISVDKNNFVKKLNEWKVKNKPKSFVF
jgi:hypothetical protein